MGFFVVTAVVSGVVILVVASLLEWILKKVSPATVESLGLTKTIGILVAIATLIYVFVMTRPGFVGPYEQWTVANIGGQLLGGGLAAGLRLWFERFDDS